VRHFSKGKKESKAYNAEQNQHVLSGLKKSLNFTATACGKNPNGLTYLESFQTTLISQGKGPHAAKEEEKKTQCLTGPRKGLRGPRKTLGGTGQKGQTPVRATMLIVKEQKRRKRKKGVNTFDPSKKATGRRLPGKIAFRHKLVITGADRSGTRGNLAVAPGKSDD